MVLLTQTIVKLSLKVSHQYNFMNLDITRNMDIIRYIEPQVANLLGSRELVLPKFVSIGQVVDRIVSKASSIFLWRNLFLEYLKLPSLTIAEQWKDIEDPVGFKAFHSLYGIVFSVLGCNYPISSRLKL